MFVWRWITQFMLLPCCVLPLHGQGSLIVTITSDNAYMFGVGDAKGIEAGSLFGAVRNLYSPEIYSNQIWDVSAKGGALPPFGLPPYYGPERYTLNLDIDGKYLYIIAWSDNARYQGSIAVFEDQQTKLRYVTGPASEWEVYATGNDLNSAYDIFPLFEQLNTQISIANRKEGKAPGSIGWVKQSGCSDETAGCRGSILFCGQFTDQMYALSPGLQEIFGDAMFMWYFHPDFPKGGCDVAVKPAAQSGEYLIFRLGPLDELLARRCNLSAPEEVSAAFVEAKEPLLLRHTLSNLGTMPETVHHFGLAIAPDAGVLPLDPLLQPGGTLAPNSEMHVQWRLHALALRQLRTAHVDVTAYDAADSVLSVCSQDIYIPAIDGLRCTIEAPDSIRFNRNNNSYVPDLISMRMTLHNILDTRESTIEAELVLTQATRLRLAPGHSYQQRLTHIDSDQSAEFEWPLVAQRGDVDESQEIVIRYRSAEQGVWKQCTKHIIVEASPPEPAVRCLAAGHDSLFADAAYEKLLPEPFEVSYTATSTGTIPLHNCNATIVLPPEFELAAGSITQGYGTINPGQSATQWWRLRTTAELSGFDSYSISWIWKSDEQDSIPGCWHRVHIRPHPSGGIIFTPLHLYFEAVRHEQLPSPQYVELWTGGALSMPWTAQVGAAWLTAAPNAGDHAASIAVQPTTTALSEGLYTTALTIAGQSPNTSRDVVVLYRIIGAVAVEDLSMLESRALSPIWPQPVAVNGEARISIDVPIGEFLRLSMHDALGREVAVLYEGKMSEERRIIRFIPSVSQLTPGMYFIRQITRKGGIARGVMLR